MDRSVVAPAVHPAIGRRVPPPPRWRRLASVAAAQRLFLSIRPHPPPPPSPPLLRGTSRPLWRRDRRGDSTPATGAPGCRHPRSRRWPPPHQRRRRPACATAAGDLAHAGDFCRVALGAPPPRSLALLRQDGAAAHRRHDRPPPPPPPWHVWPAPPPSGASPSALLRHGHWRCWTRTPPPPDASSIGPRCRRRRPASGPCCCPLAPLPRRISSPATGAIALRRCGRRPAPQPAPVAAAHLPLLCLDAAAAVWRLNCPARPPAIWRRCARTPPPPSGTSNSPRGRLACCLFRSCPTPLRRPRSSFSKHFSRLDTLQHVFSSRWMSTAVASDGRPSLLSGQ